MFTHIFLLIIHASPSPSGRQASSHYPHVWTRKTEDQVSQSTRLTAYKKGSQDLTQTVWQNRPSSRCTRPPTLWLDPQVHTLKVRNCFLALGQITSLNKTKPGSSVSTNQVNLSSHNIVLKRFQGARGIKNKPAKKKKIKLVEKWLVARSWGVGKQGEVGKRVHLPAIRRIKSEALTYNVGVRVAIQHGIV